MPRPGGASGDTRGSQTPQRSQHLDEGPHCARAGGKQSERAVVPAATGPARVLGKRARRLSKAWPEHRLGAHPPPGCSRLMGLDVDLTRTQPVALAPAPHQAHSPARAHCSVSGLHSWLHPAETEILVKAASTWRETGPGGGRRREKRKPAPVSHTALYAPTEPTWRVSQDGWARGRPQLPSLRAASEEGPYHHTPSLGPSQMFTACLLKTEAESWRSNQSGGCQVCAFCSRTLRKQYQIKSIPQQRCCQAREFSHCKADLAPPALLAGLCLGNLPRDTPLRRAAQGLGRKPESSGCGGAATPAGRRPAVHTHPCHLLGVALALSAGGCHVLLQFRLQVRGVFPHLHTHVRGLKSARGGH